MMRLGGTLRQKRLICCRPRLQFQTQKRCFRFRPNPNSDNQPFPIPSSFFQSKTERDGRPTRPQPPPQNIGYYRLAGLKSFLIAEPDPTVSDRDAANHAPGLELNTSPRGRLQDLINRIEAHLLSKVPAYYALDTRDGTSSLKEGQLDFYQSIEAYLHHIQLTPDPVALFWSVLHLILPPDSLNPALSLHTPKGSVEYLSYLTLSKQGVVLPRNRMPLHWYLTQLQYPISQRTLLPDGTDTRFIPGPGHVWKYRLWAGGSLTHWKNRPQSLPCNTIYHLIERPTDLRVHGEGQSTKAFVTIRKGLYQIHKLMGPATYHDLESDKALRLLGDRPEYHPERGTQMSGPQIEEEFTLCFSQQPPNLSANSTRAVAPPEDAQFTHTITPSRHLLFCWSAITYNAHLIHLDSNYAKQEYGASNLIVHGPLTVFLAAEYLQRMLTQYSMTLKLNTFHIHSIHYKNLQPVYVDEAVRLCAKPTKRPEPGKLAKDWIVWIEKTLPDGQKSMAFKATFTLELHDPYGGTKINGSMRLPLDAAQMLEEKRAGFHTPRNWRALGEVQKEAPKPKNEFDPFSA